MRARSLVLIVFVVSFGFFEEPVLVAVFDCVAFGSRVARVSLFVQQVLHQIFRSSRIGVHKVLVVRYDPVGRLVVSGRDEVVPVVDEEIGLLVEDEFDAVIALFAGVVACLSARPANDDARGDCVGRCVLRSLFGALDQTTDCQNQ